MKIDTSTLILSVLGVILSVHTALANVEFFLETPVGSRVTVVVNDQSITNATGRFRFFDLTPGRAQLTVYRGQYMLFRQWINLAPETRTIAFLHPQMGFRIRGTRPLYRDDFETRPDGDAWRNNQLPGNESLPPDDLYPDSSPENSQNLRQNDRPQTERIQPEEVMTDDQMEQYVLAIKRVDTGERLNFLKKTLPKQSFNTAQLLKILKLCDTDAEKLEVAKLGWDHVTDQGNFERVYSVFSGKQEEELREYCRTHQG